MTTRATFNGNGNGSAGKNGKAAHVEILQPLPWNIEAEKALLGSLMLDNEAISLVAFLDYQDFYLERHQWIYRMMLSLNKRYEPFDPITICDELARWHRRGRENRKGKLVEDATYLDAIGGPAAISELMLHIPTALHVEHYARIVERHALLRRLIGASETIQRLVHEEDGIEIADLIARAERVLLKATERIAWREPTDHRDALALAMDEYIAMAAGKQTSGIPTCSTGLNRLIGGFKPGLLYIDAGRPGMGKSSKMCAHMRTGAEHGKHVHCFSLEMDTPQLMNRLVAAEAGIDVQILTDGPLTDRLIERITIAIEKLNSLPGKITVDDECGLSPDEIRAKTLRKIARGERVDMVWIDHLQEVGNGGLGNQMSTMADIVGKKCKSFRDLGKELSIPMGVLCQLNRECEKRKDKRPMLSDLKDSGSIEETADVVMFTYRDEVYHPDTDKVGIAETITAKHRGGPKGTVEHRFTAETGQWGNLETW